MERLSSLDGVFLAIEDDRNPMNIGSVALFDGSAPSLDEVCTFLEPRLAAIPRCRQRVREPRGPWGRPLWIDDVRFDLRQHVGMLSLTDHHREDTLEAAVADVLAAPLDRRRPLWRIWIVESAETDRWAIIAAVHHCLVDGIAGNDLLGAILGTRPETEAPPGAPWVPAPEPTALSVLGFNLHLAGSTLGAHLRSLARGLGHPQRSWTRIRHTASAAKRLWYRQRHLPTSLIGPIGRRRRWTRLTVPHDDLAMIRSAFGGTVNDIVLAAVTVGFRDLLTARGEGVLDRTVTALVPVSLRTDPERGATGNRLANVHARLPVASSDSAEALRLVRTHLDELKLSHEIEATGLLMGIGRYVPRFVADRIARAVVRRQRNVETAITNVPGPRMPLYFGAHRMIECFPVAPIAGLVRITVAVWSYCDTVSIGITGDAESVPDLDTLSRGIARGFADLVTAAGVDGWG